VALGLLSTTPAWAQTIGVATLSGKVVDTQSKAPLADAVVTVTSPALQGEQTVVTDSSGFYRVPNLPPGDYTVRVEADRYRVYARGGLALRANVTVRFDVEVLPETMTAEEVTVVGRPPTVDVGSTTSGLNVNADTIERLPLAAPGGRGGASLSFESLSELVPTGRTDTYGASFAGTSSPENGYLVDGLSVSDPSVGVNGAPFSLEFVKEANVVTAGYLPEYGRTQGGVFDVVTKSGSNEFHGTLFGLWTPIQANPKQVLSQLTISGQDKLLSTQTGGFSLGGPLIKDKLWFFVGGQTSRALSQWERNMYAFATDPTGASVKDSDGLLVPTEIPGTARKFRSRAEQYQLFGKLDFRVDANNQLSLSVKQIFNSTGGDGYFETDPQTGGIGQVLGSRPLPASRYFPGSVTDITLKWSNSALNKRLLFDTTVGWHNEINSGSNGLPGDKSELGRWDPGTLSADPVRTFARTVPSRRSITQFENLGGSSAICSDVPDPEGGPTIVNRCGVGTYSLGGSGAINKANNNRLQAREVITFLFEGLGHHVIKAGGEVEYTEVVNRNAFTGGFAAQENGGGTFWTVNRGYMALTDPNTLVVYPELKYKVNSLSFGAFAQDSWSIMDRVTLNAGLRYDSQTIYTAQGDVALSMPSQFAPRIGLIFDPTQTGRAKLFANYAVYYQSVPLRLSYRGGSGEPGVNYRVRTSACDGRGDGEAFRNCMLNPDNHAYVPGIISHGPDDPMRKYAYAGFGRTFVDPDLKPGSSTEISGGGEYEIIPQGRLGLTYIHRETNSIIEDMSRDEAATYFIGNPGEGIAKDFPKAKRIYNAGIVQFTKAFSDDWLAQASYTLSSLRGNWEGYFRSATAQLDPGANSDFDLRSLVVNRYGPLDGDRRHEIKLYGAKDWQLDEGVRLTTGVSYRGRSGAPTTFLGRHPIYSFDEVFILPRGAGERLPWVHNFDVHASLGIWQSKTNSISVTADVFNLFNFQAVTRTSQRYTVAFVNPVQDPSARSNPYVSGQDKKVIRDEIITTTDGTKFSNETDRNPNFGQPTSYQEPLTLRLGLRTTF
jgi:hypothetical protein